MDTARHDPGSAMTPAALRAVLARLGWTQMQLADHIGVDHNTVSRWALGHARITERTARQIERIAQDAKKEAAR